MKKCIISIVVNLLQRTRVFFYAAISTGNAKGAANKLHPTLILGRGVIQFQRNVTLGHFPSPFFFSGYIHLEARGASSSISFGEGTYVNNNFAAVAEHKSISISKRCLIGTGVEIYDSNGHGLKISERTKSDPVWAREVVIGDDVFIGSNVKILKGVVIGNGSIIANGSIVTGDIPPNVIAGGLPAKVLRELEG